MRFEFKRSWVFMVSVVVALGLLSSYLVAQDEPPAVEEPAVEEPVEEPDPFEVPDGTPEELMEYVKTLQQQRPEGNDRRAQMEFVRKANGAMLEAADKILAGEPNDEQKTAAGQMKMASLSMLMRLGDRTAMPKLLALPEELEKAGLTDMVRPAKGMAFQIQLQQARTLGADKLDELVGQIKDFIGAAEDIGQTEMRLAFGTAQALESSGNKEAATTAYNDFAKIFGASEDEQIANFALMLEGSARRLNLLGNEMELEGITVDGEKFDWSKYKGKVVLIDFWATWCGPCLAEIPNVEKNYELYHEKGFDVVSISVDRDRAALDKFLETHETPWAMLHDADEKVERSMATHYGVMGIPTMILVGADGKVASLTVRGRALGAKLEELLGPVEEETEEEKPEEKPEEE